MVRERNAKYNWRAYKAIEGRFNEWGSEVSEITNRKAFKETGLR